MTSALRLIARELFSIFVDDVPFSLSIVAWVAVVAVLLRPALPHGASAMAGVALFLGCAAILLIGALHGAKSRKR